MASEMKFIRFGSILLLLCHHHISIRAVYAVRTVDHYGSGDVSLGPLGNGLVSLAVDGDVDLVLFPELLLFACASLLSFFGGLLCHVRRYSATCSWPNVSASSNGVLPQRSFGSNGTLHCSNRNSTQSKCPSDAAKCKAVRPVWVKKTAKFNIFLMENFQNQSKGFQPTIIIR